MADRVTLSGLSKDLALGRPTGMLRDSRWWGLIAIGFVTAIAASAFLHIDLPHGTLGWIGVLAWQPLVEELLFRGLIQGVLLRALPTCRARVQPSVSNLLTSLLFVASHFVHHSPLWAAAVLPPSLALGWLRERHRSTWSAVAMHMIFNIQFFGVAATFGR